MSIEQVVNDNTPLAAYQLLVAQQTQLNEKNALIVQMSEQLKEMDVIVKENTEFRQQMANGDGNTVLQLRSALDESDINYNNLYEEYEDLIKTYNELVQENKRLSRSWNYYKTQNDILKQELSSCSGTRRFVNNSTAITGNTPDMQIKRRRYNN